MIIGVCVDALVEDPPATRVVRRGETLTLRFQSPGAPTRITLREKDVATPVAAGNPVRFVADHPVGFHTIDVSTVWLQGDVHYQVRLDVRGPAAPSTGRRIALAG